MIFKEQTDEKQKELLEKAIEFACHAHHGQMDKAGMPYILHPLAVMGKCNTLFTMVCAVLHDVVEDTPYTLSNIDIMFGSDVASCVDSLSKRDKETYKNYILRLSEDDDAVQVKLFDIEHNSSPERLKWAEKDNYLGDLMKRYKWTKDYLLNKLNE